MEQKTNTLDMVRHDPQLSRISSVISSPHAVLIYQSIYLLLLREKESGGVGRG